jgi:hypothetical protein
MTILITERQPNRADAERCVIWLLDYYRQQALDDGIPPAAVNATTAHLAAIRAELTGPAPARLATRL